MKNEKANFWDERYNAKTYVYGTKPNVFFKEQLDLLKPGRILLPAEGEGRNALYAAKKGWDVLAFDSSTSGKEKALQLANEKKVNIAYEVTDVLNFNSTVQFDVLGLIYAHFPKHIRKEAHQKLLKHLKPNGVVVFEAFAKEQLEHNSGGPKNSEMLFSLEEIKEEFLGLDFNILKQETITLNEGEYHKGKAEVIRFYARKM